MLNVNYNPDVLSCLANLSSDEVFTPPHIANQMLDLLPDDIWKNSEVTFLDPATKSGVFLREITKRLLEGLEAQIPDIQDRVDHILTKQVFGIGITEMTAILSRRSIYCSKKANGQYSIVSSFKNETGNIIFPSVKHEWLSGKCKYCGASEENYSREESLEDHAYAFIHDLEYLQGMNMKFDVIIGNPPYQLNDGGGTGSSASPIYNHFVEQAKNLNPRYLAFIIPARWYSGGKGLEGFRREMLNDRRITKLVDFEDSRLCFPNVDIAGGVCYFLWEKSANDDCDVVNVLKDKQETKKRSLSEHTSFIRSNLATNIVRKVSSKNTIYLDSMVSSRMPFGLVSKIRPMQTGELTLVSSEKIGPYERDSVERGSKYIDDWKIFLSKASYDHAGQPNKNGQRRIFSKVDVVPPGYICTESYLAVGPLKNEESAKNMAKYLRLKFSRFLVSTLLLTQNITKGNFQFVPMCDLKHGNSDEELYKEYGLSQAESDLIEKQIMEM